MKKAFVTYLASPEFLPGILVLKESLEKSENHTELVTLLTPEVGPDIISFLETNSINFKLIDPIDNPYKNEGLPDDNYNYYYSKLRLFGLVEYEKIVYLDADMLICECIECLFDKPHMSATVAGSAIDENKNWNKINSGVLVIEPSITLFEKMETAIKILPSPSKDDQGFLHSYYPEWEKQAILHLAHCFNVPALYLDKYCETGSFSFQYQNKKLFSQNIAVIHFWGGNKPWHYGGRRHDEGNLTKYEQSINLWWDFFDSIVEEI